MKVISGRVRRLMKNDSLNRVFRRMMGVDEINPDLITRKFDNMKSHMHSFVTMIENINQAGILGEDLSNSISNFNSELNTLYISPNDLRFISDLRDINKIENESERKAKLTQILMDSKYDPEELRVVYNKLVNTSLFKHMISFVNKYNSCLKIQRATHPGSSTVLTKMTILKQSRLQFLDFLDIDFRKYFMEDVSDTCSDYVGRWLNLMYKYAKLILDEHCKPNIYPSEYVEVILESIKVARRSIQRCNDAFNMMERLVNKFEQKFNVYYKRYVISGNPYIILEYYIKDVASEVKDSDIKIKHQFRTIMDHFSKKINEAPKNDADIREVINLTNTIDLEENSEEFSDDEN